MNGIEVAQTNLDDTPQYDKTFSSENISLKEVIEGDGDVTTDGTGVATTRVYHGEAYEPAHLFFFNPGNVNAVLHPGSATWIDREKSTTWGLMDNFVFTVTARVSYCDVKIRGVPNTKYKFHYFIFVERAK